MPDLPGVATAEAALGVRLPPDYLDFLAVYGAGLLDDFLLIAAPATAPGHQNTSILELTGTFRRAAAEPYMARDLGDGEAYIHWGVDGGGGSYLWRIEGESSAEWPVCVYEDGLTVLPYGMVEFLARACTEGLPPDLQGKLRGGGGHEFLHWQDQYRRDAEQYGSDSYIGG
ncbi:SMI1/KNR4 family protein [Kitasatospora cheerisanensis]|uniref:Knr4/Smi1-like domain-containing protein n=1 Tax=Kitasatospora cheerisanensis KCTC 2395 TaxID=1348663 RepID=A0A066ZBU7_9ACTN|nr:SMI1/KNR4 family protein [Kitasatospora cheerisanensis]KDN87781.1 hypothetical protein KCH_04280 [Kitasatospora cheerisanensis KCTC 2395]